jgi:hypothetical protein
VVTVGRSRRPSPLGALLAPLLLLLVVACTGDPQTSAIDGPGHPVEIHVRWVLDSLPDVEIAIYEPLPDDRPGDTTTYAAGQAPPASTAISDGILRAEFDEPVRFVVLLSNRGTEPVRFWTPPHLALPIAAEPHLVITCLCTGEQYEVAAGGSWRRVVEYGLSRRSPTREALSITHVFVRGNLPAP